MDYSEYIVAMGTLLQYTISDSTSATPFDDDNINNILPRMIESAELRMYRDFDFLTTETTSTVITTANSRNVIAPSTFVVIQSANIITPATSEIPYFTTTASSATVTVTLTAHGYSPSDTFTVGSPTSVGGITLSGDYTVVSVIDPDNFTITADTAVSTASAYEDSGIRNSLQRTSIEYMNFAAANSTITGVSTDYALLNNTAMKLAPTPDNTYQVELLGTIRPDPLSSTNTSTFLTLYLPDLFIAASMVFGAGFQRDYGAQSDDPQMATSWMTQYDMLKGSAMVEELRKKAQSSAWQPYFPSPLATPPRQ